MDYDNRHYFLLYIFLLSPVDKSDLMYIYSRSCSYTDMVAQWLGLAFSNGPNKVGVSHPPENEYKYSFRNIVFLGVL
jgi:hypothetical protein